MGNGGHLPVNPYSVGRKQNSAAGKIRFPAHIQISGQNSLRAVGYILRKKGKSLSKFLQLTLRMMRKWKMKVFLFVMQLCPHSRKEMGIFCLSLDSGAIPVYIAA